MSSLSGAFEGIMRPTEYPFSAHPNGEPEELERSRMLHEHVPRSMPATPAPPSTARSVSEFSAGSGSAVGLGSLASSHRTATPARRPGKTQHARAVYTARLERDELPLPDLENGEALNQPALHPDGEALRAAFCKARS